MLSDDPCGEDITGVNPDLARLGPIGSDGRADSFKIHPVGDSFDLRGLDGEFSIPRAVDQEDLGLGSLAEGSHFHCGSS